MSIDLLACPFCGADPEKDGYGYYHKGDESLFIRCGNPSCHVKPSVMQAQREYGEWDIDEAWNNRATPEPTPLTEEEKLLAVKMVEEAIRNAPAKRIIEKVTQRQKGDGTVEVLEEKVAFRATAETQAQAALSALMEKYELRRRG